MFIERRPVPRVEHHHRHRFRVALMFEKRRQVARLHIPQSDVLVHRETLPEIARQCHRPQGRFPKIIPAG
jgi:hypothetical protein